MAEDARDLPATPEAAREALLDVFWDERNFMIAFGVVEVARMVLADPAGWRKALGWAHEWDGNLCAVCRQDWDDHTEVCPGKPATS